MNNNSSHTLVRINTSTKSVDSVDETLFKVFERFSNEEITNWLKRGLKESDVNRILYYVEPVKISNEQANKVARIFNGLLACHVSLSNPNSHLWRHCMNDIANDSNNIKDDSNKDIVHQGISLVPQNTENIHSKGEAPQKNTHVGINSNTDTTQINVDLKVLKTESEGNNKEMSLPNHKENQVPKIIKQTDDQLEDDNSLINHKNNDNILNVIQQNINVVKPKNESLNSNEVFTEDQQVENVPPLDTTQNNNKYQIKQTETEDVRNDNSLFNPTEKAKEQDVIEQLPKQIENDISRKNHNYEITVFICLLGLACSVVGFYFFKRRIVKQSKSIKTNNFEKPVDSIRIRTNNVQLIEFCKKTFPKQYDNGFIYFSESMIGKMDAHGYWTKEIVEEIAEKSDGTIKIIWPDIKDFYSPDTMERAVPYTSKCKVTKVISPGIIINGKVIRKAFVEVTDNF